jgi:hypothetical protein
MVNSNRGLASVVVGAGGTVPVQEGSDVGFLGSNTTGSVGFDELIVEAQEGVDPVPMY